MTVEQLERAWVDKTLLGDLESIRRYHILVDLSVNDVFWQWMTYKKLKYGREFG